MIGKTILQQLHQGAHIQRWNDHIRPKGFTELDKQGQKMIIAFVLAKYEETDRKASINWKGLIEGGFFEYFHRLLLTDIKPPVYHKLMGQYKEKLNSWVLDKLKDDLHSIDGELYHKFEQYLFDDQYCFMEKKILRASHYLATNWEFQIIYDLNSNVYGIDETKRNIENQIEEHADLAGVQKINLKKKTSDFLDFVGQLRFQQRWAQCPRIPETSVMGHMLIVAMLSYICSLKAGACDQRICNNYFAGLLHDLPEVLTRDIVSPVKKSVPGLDELIKEIEERQLDERIFPLLPLSWHRDINYLIKDEFKNRIINDKGEVEFVSSTEINGKYNDDQFSPIDGELIRACDQLAAYIEASLSISFGIVSPQLVEAIDALYGKYKNQEIAGLPFYIMFDYFKP